jgi:putative peptidoglycan lipid II flippase
MLEHGVFQARSTELVAGVLRFFVLGLVPFSIFQLFLRAFYALQDTKTPFLINCGAVALNTAFNLVLFPQMRVQGLAVGHAIAYGFGMVAQGWVLNRRIGGLDGRRIATAATRIAAAAAAMGAVVWGASRLIERTLDTSALGGQLVAVGVPVIVGVVAYLGLCLLFKVEELAYVRETMGRRLGPKPQGPAD